MPSVKAFVNKIKTKSKQYQAEQNEKKAKAKGFSSYQAYQTFSGAAKHEGEEKAKSQMRKKELNKIKHEAEQDVLLGRTGKYHKIQKKVQRGFETVEKGAGVYNEIMSELKSMGSGNDSFYPAQPKQYRRKTNKRKPQKTKSKSKHRKKDFWDQFY